MCGLAGILNRRGERIPGKDIVTMANCMMDRYDGRGGGFAGYGIYPDYKDYYAFHLFLDNEEARERVEEYLKDRVAIIKDEEVQTRKIKEIPQRHMTWRYFVEVPHRFRSKQEFEAREEDYVVDTVMHINAEIDGAFVASSGKNMGVFKAAGYPCDVARLFKVDEYKAYTWVTHGRFPTNTQGWWGGAHPFNLLDWSVVHNGEISSYGTNRRYLEMFGYHCRLLTDTEVVAYLFDLLVRKQGLSLETASTVLTPPFWDQIERMPEEKRRLYKALRATYGPAMLNGPFGIIVTNRNAMIGLNDRIKLRPLIAAEDGPFTYIASEESAIRSVAPEPQRVWAPKAGTPVVARLDKDVRP
ncbi:MAG: glutamine amidotransferase family protein [Euryarchaeota archaeon]|nr:glutamine amidotransferase family protein [Euryarchaeota archaeon]